MFILDDIFFKVELPFNIKNSDWTEVAKSSD